MVEPASLYYMRARYYDPTIGRFISEDPADLGGGDVNLYVYVNNNPVLLVDPTGLLTISLGIYEIGDKLNLPQFDGHFRKEYTTNLKEVSNEKISSIFKGI